MVAGFYDRKVCNFIICRIRQHDQWTFIQEPPEFVKAIHRSYQ